jgi:hypothetical protein
VGVVDEKQVAAHCCLAGFHYGIDGRRKTGGFICQLMVEEAFRKSLLFASLESKILHGYPSRDIHFSYGLIDDPAVLKAHMAMGFKKKGKVPVYARPYKVFRILKKMVSDSVWKSLLIFLGWPVIKIGEYLLRIRTKQSGDLFEASEFGEGFTRLFKKMKAVFPAAALRTPEVCNWRFFGNPERKYCVLGVKKGRDTAAYAVLRPMAMKNFYVMAVVDFFFPPDDSNAGKELFREIHRRSLEEGVDMAVCLLRSDSFLTERLRKSGFIKTPEFFTSVIHIPKDEEDFTERKKWHLTWFDHDYV